MFFKYNSGPSSSSVNQDSGQRTKFGLLAAQNQAFDYRWTRGHAYINWIPERPTLFANHSRRVAIIASTNPACSRGSLFGEYLTAVPKFSPNRLVLPTRLSWTLPQTLDRSLSGRVMLLRNVKRSLQQCPSSLSHLMLRTHGLKRLGDSPSCPHQLS